MTRSEQVQFVRELTDSVARQIVEHIASDNIPETWDGIEFRQFIADKFRDSVYPMKKARRAEYNNHIITTNVL